MMTRKGPLGGFNQLYIPVTMKRKGKLGSVWKETILFFKISKGKRVSRKMKQQCLYRSGWRKSSSQNMNEKKRRLFYLFMIKNLLPKRSFRHFNWILYILAEIFRWILKVMHYRILIQKPPRSINSIINQRISRFKKDWKE